MKNNTINEKEIKKFSQMASEWWDPQGKFAPLHKFNPVRIKYIKENIISHYNMKLSFEPHFRGCPRKPPAGRPFGQNVAFADFVFTK